MNIQTRIAELVEAVAKRAEIDIERTLRELLRIGTSDIRNVLTPAGSQLDPQDWADCFATLVAHSRTPDD